MPEIETCNIDPATGAVTVEAWSLVLRARTEEFDIARTVDAGRLRKIPGTMPPDSAYETATPLKLLGRTVRLFPVFSDCTLAMVSIAQAGLSFGEESTHAANVQLLQALFPAAKRCSPLESVAVFDGGTAEARFQQNAGASLYISFDPRA
jgi:hypothetical protein